MDEKIKDKVWTGILYIISLFVVVLLMSLIGYIFVKGIRYLTLEFLFGSPKIGEAGGGIGPQLFNSFYMLIIALLITIPLGIGASIYLFEYAKEGKLLNFIRLCIDTMASLPSIVVGLFGLLVFVKLTGWGFTLLSGALAVSIINLPAFTRVSESALKSASVGVKEASLGLGATRFQTIFKVILPSAMPQILTGVILASGRIFGEAAALIYTAGMSAPMLSFSPDKLFSSNSPFSLFRPAETLSVYIWQINSEGMVPDASRIGDGSSAVLILMVLFFNLFARFIGKKVYQSYTGKK
ncbi:phosphate ABC transporter permease PstA [Clostridium rectalis]|uniref:phosphate ABC transporter permease PstA n=1 Tax=Clostridium rectalis TaxID=2040295 RepID=UPI000F633E7C|nr:phosphate ABC transporter permease PstA [Clostridium rectalis]